MKLKLFVLYCLFFACQLGLAQTTRIKNFDSLMGSLNNGEQVRIIIHYAKCNWQDTTKNSPVPDAIAGMDVDIYEYFAPGTVRNNTAYVVFSNAVLIENPIGKGFVYNYGKIRIFENNSAQIMVKYIHPKSLKILMDEVFIGTINDGNNGEGINIYK